MLYPLINNDILKFLISIYFIRARTSQFFEIFLSISRLYSINTIGYCYIAPFRYLVALIFFKNHDICPRYGIRFYLTNQDLINFSCFIFGSQFYFSNFINILNISFVYKFKLELIVNYWMTFRLWPIYLK